MAREPDPHPSGERPDHDEPTVDRPQAAPQQSVLSHLSELIGNEPKVLLRDEGSDDNVLSLGTDEVKERPFLSQRFQILGEVARGGVGVILKGLDLDLGRNVAVKVLRQDHIGNAAMVERFVEEAQIGGQLQHPGIVPVYELGQQEDRRPFFAMKLVKGRTLAKLLSDRKHRREDRQQFLATFHQVCQTMAYAHSRGVIHRDLKPANVMVGAFGEVQVVDWGLAKVLKEGGVADERREQQLHQTQMSIIETIRNRPGSTGSDSIAGSVMGTPGYMPPEQANGHVDRLDERSDVFALGAILCETLTGQGPYTGTAEDVYMHAVHARLDDAFARLDEVQVDAALIELCKECLAPAQQARPSDAGEVARRIGEYLASTEERTHEAEIAAAESRVRAANERKARRLTLGLAASLLIAAGLGTGSYLFFESQRRERIQVAENAVRDECEIVRQLLGEAQRADVGDYAVLEAAALKAGHAEELARNPDVSPATREHVQQVVADVRSSREQAEHRAAEDSRNQAMLARLEELRAQSHDFGWGEVLSARDTEDSFARAFAEYGLDVAATDLDDATAWIAEQTIAIEMAFALDDWARWQRREPDPDARPWDELVILAQAADPDEIRNQIRDAVLDEDVQALEELAESPDLDEVPAPTLVFLAEALWAAEQNDQALSLFRRAHNLYPDDYSLNAALGLRLEDQDGDAAARHYAAALAARPDNPEARANLAYGLMVAQEYDESRALLDEGLRRHPGHSMLTLARAELALETDEHDIALDLCHELLQQGQNSEQLHGLIARIHYFSRDFEAAAEAYREALSLNPRSFGVRRGLAQALYHSGQRTEALEFMQGSTDSWSTFILAVLLYNEGSHAESLVQYRFGMDYWRRQANRADTGPERQRSYAWVLTMYPDPATWQPEEALRHAEAGVALAPTHPHAWSVLAAARYRVGDWLGVLEACEKARTPGQSPPYDTLAYLAALATWNLGHQERALELYEQGLREARRVPNTIFWGTQESFRREAAAVLGVE